MHFRLFRLMSVASIFVATLGFAQEATISQAPVADIDVANLAKLLLEGVQGKNWWVVASVVVTVVVWLLRTKLPKLMPQTEGFLTHPVVSVSLPVIASLASGILTAALAGPITAAILPSLLSDVLKVAFGAIAIFVAGKKVAEAREAVPDKASAVATLNKGPTP